VTIIGVADVAKSFGWYQRLLGLPETGPPTTILGRSSTRMEQSALRPRWGATSTRRDKPRQRKARQRPAAVLPVDDFDVALRRARTLASRLEEEPHLNPNTGTMEFSLRDPTVITSASALSIHRMG